MCLGNSNTGRSDDEANDRDNDENGQAYYLPLRAVELNRYNDYDRYNSYNKYRYKSYVSDNDTPGCYSYVE